MKDVQQVMAEALALCAPEAFEALPKFTRLACEDASGKLLQALKDAGYEVMPRIADTIVENGCTKACKDGEPVFILLGRDEDAPHAVRTWAAYVELRKGKSEKTNSAYDRADEMDEYRTMLTEHKEEE